MQSASRFRNPPRICSKLCTCFRFGGTPYELAERSLRLYAREVLPVLKGWGAPAAAAAK